jgi:hypothetical protein
MVVGGLLVALGLWGSFFADGGNSEPQAMVTTTTTTTTTTTPSTTTSTTTTGGYGQTSTSPAETITSGPTSGTSTTTTTLDEKTALTAFVVDFGAAIDRGDTDYLSHTLDPVAIAQYGEEACTTFIHDQILGLMNYRLTGELTGPTTNVIDGVTVVTYEGPVAFTYQGQDFDGVATLAMESDGPKWFGQCS